MAAAPPHPAESARVDDLRAHGVLDTEAEADFDALTRMAAAVCGTPIALVSLIDEDRQWFKSKVGLDVDETPREQAFCAHAILQDDLFEVPDAACDPRFAANPLVTGDPNIRFYAGAPLVSAGGLPLGTLCVIDRVRRELDERQREGLRELADQVAGQLEARRRLRALARPQDPEGRTSPDLVETVNSELNLAPQPDQPRRCGRFTVMRRIGAGGMATVYAAHDAELDRGVAIKLLHGEGDIDSRTRVQREAQALARISHPNVVQIFEIGSYGAQMFVAMELVDGPTLAEWRAARPRAVPETVDMYIQAGRGLVAAHSAGIIHRDFKADNVIVGPDGRPRVADFGIARVLRAAPLPVRADDGGSPPDVTCDGTIMGTPAYMSPEQHRSADVDERSDQFNFCAALYEALYGRRPFAGTTVAELSLRVSQGVVHQPRPDDAVPAPLHAAVMRGLAPDPDARWPSLAALLDHLRRLDLDVTRTRARERQALVGLLLALSLGAAALLVHRLRAGAPDGPAALALIALALLALALLAAWRVRDGLLVDPVHRRMLAVLLFLIAAGTVGRVLGLLSGQSVAQIVLGEMLVVAVGFAALAAFVRRAWWPLAAVHLAGAAASLALPSPAVDAVVIPAAALLFARLWRRDLKDRAEQT